MKFTVGKLSKIYAISPQSIHAYVDMGILPCVRDENGYRYFDEYGFQILGTIIKHRNAGLPLKDSSFVYENSDECEIYDRLLKQKYKLREELSNLIKQINQLDEQLDMLGHHLTKPNTVCFKTIENMVRYNLGAVEEILAYEKDKLNEISKWYSNLFYTMSSLKINYQENHISSYDYTLITSKTFFDDKIDIQSTNVEIIEEGMVASIVSNYTNTISINLLESLITRFLAEYPEYQLRSMPFTRLLTSYQDINKEKVNVFELIIPIKKIK